MAVHRRRVGCVRAIRGKKWIECDQLDREAHWIILRARFDDDLRKGGWRLCGEPRERTEYDEERGDVWLRISAMAEYET